MGLGSFFAILAFLFHTRHNLTIIVPILNS